MIIDKSWTIKAAFERINQTYRPGGQLSGPQRNRLVETWGQLVGKSRALKELDFLIEEYGSIKNACKAIQMSPRTMRNLKGFFESLPDELERLQPLETYSFKDGEKVELEEDLNCEFKEIKGGNPVKAIQNLVDEYVIAFLNGSGGSVFWGITDSSIVKSIELNGEQKDSVRKVINSKINSIEPPIDPSQIKVMFHLVQNKQNNYVIQVAVPKSNSIGLYFKTSGDTWVRINGCKQKLQGVALQEHILKRMQISM